jgi:hypothetical protein
MDKKEMNRRYWIILFTILVITVILIFIPAVSWELKCGFIGLFVGVLYLWMAAYLKDSTSKRDEQRNAMAILMIFAVTLLLLAVGIDGLLTQLGLTRKVSMNQEPVVTEEPVATATPTEALTETPTATPLACVALLAPENGADLPVTGKVTFSWTAMDGAERYVLNFILPSGQTVSFETDQTSRNRYMEAFVAGGEYQWQVAAHRADGREVCVSEVFVFDKPPHE